VGALAGTFLARWKGCSAVPQADLQTALEEVIRVTRERWPDIPIDPTDFAEYLGERAACDTDPITALRKMRVEDLYLACGCANGSPSAMRWLETNLLSKLPARIVQATRRPDVVDETLQVLREKLFLCPVGGRPRIAQYAGHGALENWVRMAALRTALDLLAAEKPHESLESSLDGISAGIAGTDLELDYIKARYRATFVTAFRETVAALPDRERNLLRFQYIDELTPERIGRIYGVHRTTAMRWVATAQEHLLHGIRGALMKQLQITETECDSLLNLVRSRLPVTLHTLLHASRN
jgi:RNA polymerase sigma-70 factor (ECF subfamily)